MSSYEVFGRCTRVRDYRSIQSVCNGLSALSQVSAATIAEYLAPLYLVLLGLVVWGVREYAKRDTFTWDTYLSCAGAYFFGFGIL
eukprot:6197097-Prorocentrum_lima.AAC.1